MHVCLRTQHRSDPSKDLHEVHRHRCAFEQWKGGLGAVNLHIVGLVAGWDYLLKGFPNVKGLCPVLLKLAIHFLLEFYSGDFIIKECISSA